MESSADEAISGIAVRTIPAAPVGARQMNWRPILELIELIVILALVMPGLKFAFGFFAPGRKLHWSDTLEKRRLSLLLLVLLAVVALNVGEDALDGESHALDVLTLLTVHDHVSSTSIRFFEVITLTGSWKFLTPLTIVASVALLWMRRRFEAVLLAASVTGGALTVYVVKALAARERPALWDTEVYWGSSFPSGHTLVVAAFAIAAVLCTIRIRYALKAVSISIALLWITLVGTSRLVLGVHWPTDVLVAACLGAALPIAISIVHELWQSRVQAPTEQARHHQ